MHLPGMSSSSVCLLVLLRSATRMAAAGLEDGTLYFFLTCYNYSINAKQINQISTPLPTLCQSLLKGWDVGVRNDARAFLPDGPCSPSLTHEGTV